MLAAHLELDIPECHLLHFLQLAGADSERADLHTLAVSAMTVDGICATVFKQPRQHNNGSTLFAIKQDRRQCEVRQGIGKGMLRGAVMKLVEETDVFVFNISSRLEMKEEDQARVAALAVAGDDGR